MNNLNQQSNTGTVQTYESNNNPSVQQQSLQIIINQTATSENKSNIQQIKQQTLNVGNKNTAAANVAISSKYVTEIQG